MHWESKWPTRLKKNWTIKRQYFVDKFAHLEGLKQIRSRMPMFEMKMTGL